jgi:hypothetical protein
VQCSLNKLRGDEDEDALEGVPEAGEEGKELKLQSLKMTLISIRSKQAQVPTPQAPIYRILLAIRTFQEPA